MKSGHVIKLVPAWISACIIPHAVAAPAMVDLIFIQVITPVEYAPLLKDLLHQVYHVPGVIRPVAASINQEDVELCPIIPELLLPGYI